MKINYAKIICAAVFVAGMLALFTGYWMDSVYKTRMPQMPTSERTVKLSLDHGAKVFVTQEEYVKYQKYDTLSSIGIAISMFAGFLYGAFAKNAGKE